MPKLPEEKSATILEVADKKSYSRGEITYPKVPRYRIVFRHHLKAVLVLIAIGAILVLVFLAGVPFINRDQTEESPQTVSDLDNFKAPNENNLKYLNLEYHVSLTVDKVDQDKKLIYGTNLFGDGKQYVVRVLDKTRIQQSPGPNEPVLISSDGANLKTVADIGPSSRISVVATEDPKAETYLNAASVVIE